VATGGDGSYTYSWDNGASLNDAAIAQPSATPTSTTIYEVTVTDGNGCEDSDQVTITVNDNPSVDAGVDATICSGESETIGNVAVGGDGSYTYSWDNAASLDDASIAQPSASPSSTTTYEVTVTDGNGCVDTDQVTITVNPDIVADAGSDVSVCTGSSIGIGGIATGGDGNFTYSWDNAGTLDNAAVATPSASPTSTTTYEVTVTDGNGCTDSDQVVVTVNSLPSVSITTSPVSGTACGANVTLTATAGFVSYDWLDQGLVSTGDTDNEYDASSTGTYTVEVEDANGCVNQESQSVTILNQPEVTVVTGSANQTICDGSSIEDIVISLSGSGSLTASVTGLPAGVTYDPGTLTISGTPASGGPYNYTITTVGQPAECTADVLSGTITLSTAPTATVEAGSDVSQCNSGTPVDITLSGASFSGTATGASWNIVSGGGSLSSTAVVSDPSTIVYTPANGFDGVAVLELTTEGSNGNCSVVTDQVSITLSTAATATVTVTDQSVCESTTAQTLTLFGSSYTGTATAAQWTVVSSDFSLTGAGLGSTAFESNPSSVTFEVPANVSGDAVLELTTQGSDGNCSVATDQMTISVIETPTPITGNDVTVCESNAVQTISFSGASLGDASTTSWSIIADPIGVTLNDPNSSDPSQASISVPANGHGVITLELLGEDASSLCSDLQTLTVTINEAPTVTVGSDFSVCSDPINPTGGFLGFGAIGGSATAGQWSGTTSPPTTLTISNTGFVADPSTVDASVPAGYTGTVTFTLTSNDPFGCGADSENLTVTIDGESTSSTWTGAIDDDWFKPGNWTDCVPGTITDAVIPVLADPNVTPYPRIYDANADCRTIEIQGNATVEITGSWILEVHQ
jgi:hypothetical protein